MVRAGKIPSWLIQKYFNKWVPACYDLFGTDGSSSAHWAYIWGLKGRYNEGATAELLKFMGYEELDRKDGVTRLIVPGGNGASLIDIETMPNVNRAAQGAGSVHHVAFAVENREKQLEVRKALIDTGYHVTPVIDRDYFWAIYFRTPGGVLFEIATNEPGFDRDEDVAHLGEALQRLLGKNLLAVPARGIRRELLGCESPHRLADLFSLRGHR